MFKMIPFYLLVSFVAPCLAMNSANTQPQVAEDATQYDENEYPYWNGPGWYWGIYINNETDYWHHYDQRYPNRPGHTPDRQENLNRGDRGGGGHSGGMGGGGHGGGGHR